MARQRRPPGDAPRDDPQPQREPARADLSARHRRTLEAIFERPTRANIPWRDVEALFVACGGTVTNGSGSRRRVRLGDRRAVFHEPHPEKVTDKGAIENVREFLASAGVRP